MVMNALSRRYVLPLVLGFAMLTGCSKDDEVNAALDVVESTSNELFTTVTTAKDPKAGIAAGKAYLDKHRDELRKAGETLNEVRGFQINDATTARLEGALVDALVKVPSLEIELMGAVVSDPQLDKELDALIEDYSGTLNLAG